MPIIPSVRREFKQAVKALHQAGLEVILDIVQPRQSRTKGPMLVSAVSTTPYGIGTPLTAAMKTGELQYAHYCPSRRYRWAADTSLLGRRVSC